MIPSIRIRASIPIVHFGMEWATLAESMGFLEFLSVIYLGSHCSKVCGLGLHSRQLMCTSPAHQVFSPLL